MAIERPKFPLAVHTLIVDSGRVLLFRRQNTGYRDGHFTDPAGHVEKDQPATAEACREAFEEVDINVRPENLRLIHVVHHGNSATGSTPYVHFFFQAVTWSGEPRLKEDKGADLGWYSLDALPEPMVPEVAIAIGSLHHSFYSEFDW